LSQAGIKNSIGDLVTYFVGVAFSDRFRGKEKGIRLCAVDLMLRNHRVRLNVDEEGW
jgi:hypothetical protein